MLPKFKIPLAELECDYARSSGPGGQNVNKVNSKCILRWAVASSPSLPADVRRRFVERFANRITHEGDLVLMSDRFRDQKRNFEDCVDKAQTMLDAVAVPPKKRVKTKPTKGSKRRRLEEKTANSQKKALRRGFSE
ncbi:alternative ribosome rescue aminoacyl-tRNA hydrolase ArfB [Bdellovibrionota bacterium FG-1]